MSQLICAECKRQLRAPWCNDCYLPTVMAKRLKVSPRSEEVLGSRYRILGLYGSGGMGEVFLALDVRLWRLVCAKIAQQDCAGDLDERLHREAAGISRLYSPHAVVPLDLGQCQDGASFMIEEFAAGQTLSELLKTKPRLGITVSMDILLAVTDALTEAHAHGVIHRDLKPGNVVVHLTEARPVAKVIDWGIVFFTEGPLELRNHLTQTGYVVGSIRYMAPELMDGGPATPQSDLFALGKVAVRMLWGGRAMDSRSDVPKALVALIKELTNKQANRRPASAADVAKRLRVIAASCDDDRTEPIDLAAGATEATTGLERIDQEQEEAENGSWIGRPLAALGAVTATVMAALLVTWFAYSYADKPIIVAESPEIDCVAFRDSPECLVRDRHVVISCVDPESDALSSVVFVEVVDEAAANLCRQSLAGGWQWQCRSAGAAPTLTSEVCLNAEWADATVGLPAGFLDRVVGQDSHREVAMMIGKTTVWGPTVKELLIELKAAQKSETTAATPKRTQAWIDFAGKYPMAAHRERWMPTAAVRAERRRLVRMSIALAYSSKRAEAGKTLQSL